MVSHRCRFDSRNCGGDNRNEEVLQWVLDQGGRCAGVCAIAMAGGEVVAVDIAVKDVQSKVNETANEENKWVVWQNKRGNKQMFLTSFFAAAMYRHNVLENTAIAAIAAQRW